MPPIRRILEIAVAQDADGVWRQREIWTVRRWRVRAVSDRSRVRSHQQGRGEDFEVVVDHQLEIWFRRFGSDGVFRRDEDAAGVGLTVVEDITLGVAHEVSYSTRPSDALVRWSCLCGDGARVWIDPGVARVQAERHCREASERDLRARERSDRRMAERAAADAAASAAETERSSGPQEPQEASVRDE